MRPLALLRSNIRPLPHLGQMPPVSFTRRLVPRHSGKPLQARNLPYLPTLMTMGRPQRSQTSLDGSSGTLTFLPSMFFSACSRLAAKPL